MGTHTIYDFYSYVETISTIFSFAFAIILFFCSLCLLNYDTSKREIAFCVIIAVFFAAFLSCSLYMNYLQIR